MLELIGSFSAHHEDHKIVFCLDLFHHPVWNLTPPNNRIQMRLLFWKFLLWSLKTDVAVISGANKALNVDKQCPLVAACKSYTGKQHICVHCFQYAFWPALEFTECDAPQLLLLTCNQTFSLCGSQRKELHDTNPQVETNRVNKHISFYWPSLTNSPQLSSADSIHTHISCSLITHPEAQAAPHYMWCRLLSKHDDNWPGRSFLTMYSVIHPPHTSVSSFQLF